MINWCLQRIPGCRGRGVGVFIKKTKPKPWSRERKEEKQWSAQSRESDLYPTPRETTLRTQKLNKNALAYRARKVKGECSKEKKQMGLLAQTRKKEAPPEKGHNTARNTP